MDNTQLMRNRLPVGSFGVALLQTVICLGFAAVFLGMAGKATAQVLSLEAAVEAAQANDPWLVESKHAQDAVEAMGVAAGTLPDPQINLGLANFPTDTFDIDQEPMTQVIVGVKQMFPRGDSLRIKREQLQTQGLRYPFQRQDRRAITAVMVGKLWFDAYKAQESIRLIERDRPLFEQLGDVAEAGYSAALGKTRQQDIVRAQLELTTLDDRLTMLKQQQETVLEKLFEWISGNFAERYQTVPAAGFPEIRDDLQLPRQSPQITMLQPSLYTADTEAGPQELYGYFEKHPAVLAIEQNIKAGDLGIELARQSYKPEWGLSASYGYRDDPPSGDRPDFLSMGVSFDLPVFTKNRQDKQVQAAVSQAEAIKTKKWSLVRSMIADFAKNKAKLKRLNERQNLYKDLLLPQMHEQAEASLTAYTNDVGDFAEVVRARITELNAQLEALNIGVEKQKTIIDLNYYFMKNAEDIVTTI